MKIQKGFFKYVNKVTNERSQEKTNKKMINYEKCKVYDDTNRTVHKPLVTSKVNPSRTKERRQRTTQREGGGLGYTVA